MTNKTTPTYDMETKFGAKEGKIIAGIDEVGYGSLAGPVVAAAVIISPTAWKLISSLPIKDSKQLSAKQRNYIDFVLRTTKGIQFGIGHAGVKSIQSINILQASFKAISLAISNLYIDHCLLDGRNKPQLKVPVTAIIKGDQKVVSIACASIIAKVWRDKWMTRLSKYYPNYYWENNAGYGTLQHRQSIKKYGITKFHRLQFVSKTINTTSI